MPTAGSGWRAELSARGDASSAYSPTTAARAVSITSPKQSENAARPVVSVGDIERKERGGSLWKIFLRTLYVATVASLVRPEDDHKTLARKLLVGLLMYIVNPFFVVVLIEVMAALYSAEVVTLLAILAATIISIIICYFLARRWGEVSDALFAASASLTILGFIGSQFTLPGTIPVMSLAVAMIHTNHSTGPLRLGVAFLVLIDISLAGYNTIAMRQDWKLIGYNLQNLVVEFTWAAGCIASTVFLLAVFSGYRYLYEQENAARLDADTLLREASEMLLAFNLEGLSALYTSQKETSGGRNAKHLLPEMLPIFIKTVAQFRPHVPHYVMVAVRERGDDWQGDMTSRSMGDTGSMRSSTRHRRRLDLSGRGSDEDSARAASRVADDRSLRSHRTDAGVDLSRGVDGATNMSPIFLARKKPVITRRVTLVQLDFVIPVECATRHGYEVFIDTLLTCANSFEGSVHSVIGDTVTVSWNAVRSVRQMERLACRFTADAVWFVRGRFTHLITADDSAAGGGNMEGGGSSSRTPPPAAQAMGESSASRSTASAPRVTGAVMTGDARLCFAGTRSTELLLSYSWQPVLQGLRRLAAGNHMICIDATTKSSVGPRLKTRAIGSIGVARGPVANNLVARGFATSHTLLSGSRPSGGDNPLIELQHSPQTSQIYDPPTSSQPAAVAHVEEHPEDSSFFDFVAYELVAVLDHDATSPLPSSNPNRPAANASPRNSSLRFPSAGSPSSFPTSSALGVPQDPQEFDDDPVSLVVGSPHPAASGLNARLQSKQRKPEDPDDLLTRAVHVATNDRQYAEAARRFRELLDVLKSKAVAEQSSNPASSEFPFFPPPSESVHRLPPSLPGFENSVNAVPGGGVPVASPDHAGVLSTLSVTQLISLVSHLHMRAVTCTENPNAIFADSVVTVPNAL